MVSRILPSIVQETHGEGRLYRVAPMHSLHIQDYSLVSLAIFMSHYCDTLLILRTSLVYWYLDYFSICATYMDYLF